MSTPLTLLESAEQLGQYRFVELACFAHLGERAPRAEAPELAGYFACAARAHGFRAALIESRLPVSVGLPSSAELTVPSDPRLEAFLGELSSGEEGAVLELLLATIYPSMLGGYRWHIDRCSPYADPPVRRLLERLVSDLDSCVRQGEALVGLRDSRSTSQTSELQALGGIFGPGPWGD